MQQTPFESEQFKQRFGENAVIPIWIKGTDISVFDISREYGGLTIDCSKPLDPQVAEITGHLSEKLTHDRAEAAARVARDAEADV